MFISAVHYTHNDNAICIVAIVGCTHVERATASFEDLVGNIAQENTTTDILVENQLRPPLDMVTVGSRNAVVVDIWSLLVPNYDERTYCTLAMLTKIQRNKDP